MQRRKWSCIKHLCCLCNKCIKFSKYFARKKAFIFEIVSFYCVLEIEIWNQTYMMASLFHHFRFIDLVGLMSTNVKYIFVLEHIAKLNLYMRSYLKQVEFWFLSAFRFWKSAHLIQFLYFVSDESNFEALQKAELFLAQ